MTKEMRVRKALDLYDSQMEAHRIEYSAKFHSLRKDEFGQIDNNELMELNMWAIQKENRIKNAFIRTVFATE